jgi:flagellar hook-associated protein 2
MGSPVTLSGFNSIDFSLILNAVMQQERIPVQQLENQKKVLEAQKTAFSTLASKLSSLQSAVEDLLDADAFNGTVATSSDTSRVAVSASGTAPAGTYEIYVQQLARAQVTTSSTDYADTDETAAISAGTLTVNGVDITLTEPTTLAGLASAINSSESAGVSASIVRNTSGRYQLVLTSRETGQANGFSVTGTPAGLAFNATNAQEASDAEVRINGVTATSDSNVFEGVIPGVTFTALRQDVANPVTITITASSDSLKSLIEKVVSAFRDALKFVSDQTAAAARGESNNIGRDALVRGLRRQLVSVLNGTYAGGQFGSLAEVGFEFTRAGEFTFNSARFEEALQAGKTDVATLFRGADGSGGAFGALESVIGQYTDAGGLVPNAQERLTSQVRSISDRIGDLEDRLAIKREALQREFTAADQAIAQLNQQAGSLSSLGSGFRLF